MPSKAARGRLADARENETAAAARLAEVETALATLRIEQTEADAVAGRIREDAHARELDINRREQQIALDQQQAAMLEARASELEQERQHLEARREPERLGLEGRRQAVAEAENRRDAATGVAQAAAEDYARAQQAIEAVEQDVERARADVYAVLNTVTALNAAVQSAGAQRERAVQSEQRFEMESRELAGELDKVRLERQTSGEQLRRAQDGLDAARVARAASETELANARVEHEWRARDVRSREHELAGTAARLRSLEELDAHRAGFADAARMVLVNANGRVGQMGALADFVEVEPRYERAVEACLGDLLQHVLVERIEHVSAGLQADPAGRRRPLRLHRRQARRREASTPGVRSRLGVRGTCRHRAPAETSSASAARSRRALRAAIGDALIAESFDTATRVAPLVPFPVATIEGDVFRGQSRGDRRRQGRVARHPGHQARDQGAARAHRRRARRPGGARRRDHRVRADDRPRHRRHPGLRAPRCTARKRRIVSIEAQVSRAAQDEFRVQQRVDLVATETRRVREEIDGLDLAAGRGPRVHRPAGRRQARGGRDVRRLPCSD